MPENAILLSVQPRYAKKIFEGKKKVELRRIRPNVQHGDLVIIYASSPVMAVMGSFSVDHVMMKHPRDLWPFVEQKACISREEFNRYYRGSRFGVAIFLSDARPVNKPLRLEEIREAWPNFRPPQGFRYLASMDQKSEIFVSAISADSTALSIRRKGGTNHLSVT
jgi:predicted transcriptional regulator